MGGSLFHRRNVKLFRDNLLLFYHLHWIRAYRQPDAETVCYLYSHRKAVKRGGIYFITWLTVCLAGVYIPMIGQFDSLIKNKKNGNI